MITITYHNEGKVEDLASINFLCSNPCAFDRDCYRHGVLRRNPRAYAVYLRNGYDFEQMLLPAGTIIDLADAIKGLAPVGFRPCSVGDLNTPRAIVNMIRLCRRLDIPVGMWVTPRNEKLITQLKYLAPDVTYNWSCKYIGALQTPGLYKMDNSFVLYETEAQKELIIRGAEAAKYDWIICPGKCKDCMVCYNDKRYVVLEKMRRQGKPEENPGVRVSGKRPRPTKEMKKT